jgi:tetratricopeptide (TPR) repeat protein
MPDAVRRGLDACRRGNWQAGLPVLAQAAEKDPRGRALPGLVYSYLGYGIALREHRVQDGLKLCQHAVKLEFYQAENYLNLARTLLLSGNRRAAVRALEDGLQVEPDNPELLKLQGEMGTRRAPVLPFLSRSNPVNLLLGKLRHLLTG